MQTLSYTTPSGIVVARTETTLPYEQGLKWWLRQLDSQRGVYLSSGYEYPERYSRWDVASICPPLELIARLGEAHREVTLNALNERGRVLIGLLETVLAQHPHVQHSFATPESLKLTLRPMAQLFSEEERSRQPSAFSILRALTEEFRHPEDSRLCLIGAFGFDLLFQFDPIPLRLPRTATKDFHLFLCDDICFMDRKKEQIVRYQYDFSHAGRTTEGLARTGEPIAPPEPRPQAPITSDHTPAEYMANVDTVREGMRQGDFYEVVLRQTFQTTYTGLGSALFERIQQASPSPYEFYLQLGDEQLIGASPEMFVRVEGQRIETCPISGTARRTGDPLRDAENIRELLNSAKEESELTMCTDVDRNDKSRVCLPGSVKVIGRRLIESYAGVFHTVDHVEGTLEKHCDGLDAFLTHMWAVTVIGAPKRAAAMAIESLEKNARGWYGGAVGVLALNGDINTGILIRTVHLRNGEAKYPVGATLLYDSVPEMEEQETRLKATGFFRVFSALQKKEEAPAVVRNRERVKMLLVDNDDCFIHTLANYARQTGAEVVTYRAGFPLEMLREINPDLILVSPGPGRPADFGVPDLIRRAAHEGYPVFGVCLGLQGMVEAFGGELGVLPYPMHGKPSEVAHDSKGVFEGLPTPFRVGRYHSLYAVPEKLPACFEVTARSEDGVIMGVRHRELPLEAVQFHPESLLSMENGNGLKLVQNAVQLAKDKAR